MDEDPRDEDGGQHAQGVRLVDEGGARWRRWSVLLPAFTSAGGLARGAAVLGASTSRDDEGKATALSRTPAAPSPTRGDLAVRVPGPSLEAAGRAPRAYALVEQGVTAGRELDARGLADLVDRVQRQRPEAQALVDACRTAAGEAVVQPPPPS